MSRQVLGSMVLALLLSHSLCAQQASSSAQGSSKFKKILTSAGAGGGFAAGVFVGLAMFDDSINSDRKVWATAILGAGAGGVGGYFAGRAVDRSKSRTSGLTLPVGGKELEISPTMTPNGKGVRLAMQW